MNRLRVLGAAVSAAAVAGYVAGIWITYPGRAISIAGFMVGATLFAVGSEE